MIEVYHASKMDFAAMFDTATKTYNKADFVKVAEVDTDNADTAFMLTNSIERSWTENEEVQVCVDTPIRSTSTGDILVAGGESLIVRAIGFDSVEFK